MANKKPKNIFRTFPSTINAGISVVDPNIIQDKILSEMIASKPNHPLVKAIIRNPYYNPQILKSYMQKLMDDGKMMKFRDVKKMDILDTMDLLPPPDNGYGVPSFENATEEEKAAIKRLGWYSCIPCFEKGALKINTFRYIVFEVLEMDAENQSVKIRLRDYMKPDESFWQMGVGATVTIKASQFIDETGNEHYVHLALEEKQNFEDLYTMYSAKELGWSKSEYKQWMDIIVANASEVTKEVKQQIDGDQCDQLANTFILIINRCNAMLEMNKPSRPIKKSVSSGNRTVSYEKGKSPERKIRMVGTLRVQSKEIPRKPCLESIITYKTAKWTVRGHVRRYKNGKEVYIKPTTRTRKALADTNETTATTIRFKKKKGKD